MMNRLKYLIRYSAEEFFEFFLGTSLTLWGISLFFPARSSFNGTPNRIILNIIAKQEIFAVIALILGLFYLVTLFQAHPTLQKWTNLAITFFWTFVATVYFANNFTSTSFVLYGLLAIFSGLTFLRKND